MGEAFHYYPKFPITKHLVSQMIINIPCNQTLQSFKMGPKKYHQGHLAFHHPLDFGWRHKYVKIHF